MDESRLDAYRSWTKVDWMNPGLDENSVGRKQVGRKLVGRKWIGRKVGLPSVAFVSFFKTSTRVYLNYRIFLVIVPQNQFLDLQLSSEKKKVTKCFLSHDIWFLKQKISLEFFFAILRIRHDWYWNIMHRHRGFLDIKIQQMWIFTKFYFFSNLTTLATRKAVVQQWSLFTTLL